MDLKVPSFNFSSPLLSLKTFPVLGWLTGWLEGTVRPKPKSGQLGPIWQKWRRKKESTELPSDDDDCWSFFSKKSDRRAQNGNWEKRGKNCGENGINAAAAANNKGKGDFLHFGKQGLKKRGFKCSWWFGRVALSFSRRLYRKSLKNRRRRPLTDISFLPILWPVLFFLFSIPQF